MTTSTLDMTALVKDAVATIDDPEYPGVSIVDLGLLESLKVDGDCAHIGLIPTFSGCPALTMIKDDVTAAVQAVEGISSVIVEWLHSPAWSSDRVTEVGRAALAQEFTVSVQIGSQSANCPLCGTPTEQKSLFGPSRCRAVHRCNTCNETVEVMRG